MHQKQKHVMHFSNFGSELEEEVYTKASTAHCRSGTESGSRSEYHLLDSHNDVDKFKIPDEMPRKSH